MNELVIIQNQLKAPKNQINKFGGYRYRSAEDILEAVKPLLKENDCTLTISDEMLQVGERIYVKAIARLKSNKTGEAEETSAFAREEASKKGMDAAQITGAASSYARKYALNGLFCIDDTKDPDYTQGSESKDKEEGINIDRVVEQVRIATTIDELTALWNNFKKFDSDRLLANAISMRRKELGV